MMHNLFRTFLDIGFPIFMATIQVLGNIFYTRYTTIIMDCLLPTFHISLEICASNIYKYKDFLGATLKK